MISGTTSMEKSATSSRPEFTSLVPALSKVLDRVGEGRLELSVSVCDTVEVPFPSQSLVLFSVAAGATDEGT